MSRVGNSLATRRAKSLRYALPVNVHFASPLSTPLSSLTEAKIVPGRKQFDRSFFGLSSEQSISRSDQQLPAFANLNQLLHFSDLNDDDGAINLISLLQSLANMAERPDALLANTQVALLSSNNDDAKLASCADTSNLIPLLNLEKNESFLKLMQRAAAAAPLMCCQEAIEMLKAFAAIKNLLPVTSCVVMNSGLPILKRFVRNEIQAEPDEVAELAFRLAQAGIVDLSLPRFLREVAPNVTSKLSFAGVRTLMRTCHLIDFRDTDILNDMCDRLTNGTDYFENNDVVDTFRVDYETSMISRRCYLKLSTLVTRHFELFTPVELVELFHLMCSLQHIHNPTPILNFLESRISVLTDAELVQLLVGAMLVGERMYANVEPFLTTLLDRRPVPSFSSAEALTVAYAIAHFHVEDLASQLKELLLHYFANVPEAIPADQLAMLSEVLVSIENEFGTDLASMTIPDRLRQASDNYALSRSVDWRIKKNVLLYQNELPPSHRVNFQPNVVVGPYVAPFVDEEKKLIMEVFMPKASVGVAMRQRHFERLGYKVVRLSGKAFLHTRIPDALTEILARCLDYYVEGEGLLDKREIIARRTNYDSSEFSGKRGTAYS